MTPLDFTTEPPFECANDDSGDAAFVCVASLIGGQDAVEEYLACGMLPLSANFGFTEIVDGETPMSKVVVLLPEFPLTRFEGQSNDYFLVRVELDAENVVGSYSRAEHDACIQALPNGGCLNRVFERAGVAYGPRMQPNTEASAEVVKKRKADACVMSLGKWMKVAEKKRTTATPKATATKADTASAWKAGARSRARGMPKASTTLMAGVATSKDAAVGVKGGPRDDEGRDTKNKVWSEKVHGCRAVIGESC
jgi:hypothetical protein